MSAASAPTDRRLRLGLVIRSPLRRPGDDPTGTSGLGAVLELAAAAEQAGYDTFLLDGVPAPIEGHATRAARVDAFVVLGAVAVSSLRIRLGCLAPPFEQRPPAVLAKVVTSLDTCSDGRAVLALGPPAHCGEEGLDELREALEVCRALLRVPAPSFAGRHYQLSQAYNEPRQSHAGGGLPIALSLPSGLPGEVKPPLFDLASRFAELCVLGLGIGEDPSAAVPMALELLAPAARRAGRVAGSPELVVRLPATGRSTAGLATSVRSCLAAGASGVVVDWSLSEVTPEEVSALAELVGAALRA